MTASWLAAVQGTGRTPAEPAGIADAHRVASEAGGNVVDWATDIGYTMANTVIEMFPELGRNPAQFEVLHRGTTATVLRCILLILGSADEMVTNETLAAAKDFVHRGIPLPGILRSIQLGHAYISEAILSAIITDDAEADKPQEMQRVSSILFHHTQQLLATVEQVFHAEYEATTAMSAASRLQMAGRLIRDEVDPGHAERTLGYPLDRRHIALVSWIVGNQSREMNAQLQAVARDVLEAFDCDHRLMIPVGSGVLWAWGTVPTTVDPAAVVVGSTPPIDVALGAITHGVGGFRSSHRQAQAVEQLLSSADPHNAGRVTAYVDVESEVLMTSDRQAAQSFVERMLGDLAHGDSRATELRTTLLRYLESGKSLARTAEQLHIARSTVIYRVRRAEELSNHTLDGEQFMLHAALRVSEFLHGQ